MNNYRGTSILTWQPRRLTEPEHSLQETFTDVLRRSRLHVIPLLYAQWWSIHHCLGSPHCAELPKTGTGPATCCSVCMPHVRENSQRDSNDERFEVGVTGDQTRRNNQLLTTFYRMQHNTVSITPADHLVPIQRSYSRRSGHNEIYQVPYARTNVTSTPSFQQLHACGTLYLHLWSILIRFSPSKQPSVFITDTDSRDHRPQCVILGLSRDALHWKMKMKIILNRWRVIREGDFFAAPCIQA